MPQAVGFDLAYAAKRSPYGHAELIPENECVAGARKLVCKTLSLWKDRAVAVQHDLACCVPTNKSLDLSDVRYVDRHRYARTSRDISRARYVADRILQVGSRIEHERFSIGQYLLELFRGQLIGWVADLGGDR